MSRGPSKSFDPERVLELAMVEFWTRGYSATSISHLRSATGLGAKSLYDTFGGKREIFLAAIDHYGATVVQEMFDKVVAKEKPHQALKKIFKKLDKALRMVPHRGCLLGVAAAEVEDDPDLAKAVNTHLSHIQSLLQQTIAELPLKPTSPAPQDLASHIMVLFQGAYLVSRVEIETKNVEVAVRTGEHLLRQCMV